MKFIYGKQDMQTLEQAQQNCWLLANGLGGYASTSAAFSVTRGDQGILIAAETAPSRRVTLVHRLSEQLVLGDHVFTLSTQEFANRRPPEEGFRNLSSFVWDGIPRWDYCISGVSVQRTVAVGQEENTASVRYRIENRSGTDCTLRITPLLLCLPKGTARKKKAPVRWNGKAAFCEGYSIYVNTNGTLLSLPVRWEKLFYRDDAKDDREKQGLAVSRFMVEKTVSAGETAELELLFSDSPTQETAGALIEQQARRHQQILKALPFRDPVALELACSADAYISRRDSTNGKTILAGYPFFGDWGRDTMISLPGCVLAPEQFDTAKSILKTFLAYEQDGLVPNLFPEGDQAPMYNTVDAALLLINSLWLYYERTQDFGFVKEAWPVLERIIAAYRNGTRHGIRMDADGLIQAGEGLDQVTWMDVCVEGILPTPRHGKPVEINAYWYNALRIMDVFSMLMDEDGTKYASMAEKAKASFIQQFWMPEKGCLKDVLSGTSADCQIRCNQIWAITMPFTMLSPEQERQVVDTVFRELYTPCGLRTLSPSDPEFHPSYGGPQKQRDLAYHQGTVWVFPLGAYYRAYLKVHQYSRAAAAQVRSQLEAIVPMLREGCVGQLPEIYDGLYPGTSQGCFAQAWSVGEMLTVYALLEQIEQEEG